MYGSSTIGVKKSTVCTSAGPLIPPVHTRIVRGPEVDQDPVVGLRGDVTQHLSELASGEFARSTGAGDHLRQTLGHSFSFSCESGPRDAWHARQCVGQ